MFAIVNVNLKIEESANWRGKTGKVPYLKSNILDVVCSGNK